MQAILQVAFVSLLGLASAVPVPVTTTGSNATTAAAVTPINGLLLLAGNLPGINGAITSLSGAATIFQAGAAATLGVKTTQNDLSAGAACKDMTVIFARGTTEPGNVGLFAGPSFFDALTSMLGTKSLAVQGVDYGATVAGFLQGGDAAGSQTMATLVSNTLTACPNTKLVMSGYSQGAQVVHNAANLLPAATMAQVSSIVAFGDPNNGTAFTGASPAKSLVVCHATDNICQHGDLILLAHLTYSEDAKTAATFAAQAAGVALGN